MLKDYSILLIALLVFFISLISLLITSLRANGSHFIYALDDAYIHMAIAKNFSMHSVWGVTRYSFTSSTSSPFYTLLISIVYVLFGVHDVVPFLLNILFSVLLLIFIYFTFKKNNNLYVLVVLISLIFFSPLHYLIFCGLEHILHALLITLFVYLSCKILSRKDKCGKEGLYLIALSLILPLTRYESFITIFIVAFLFIFVKRNVSFALLMIVSSIVPVVIYGLISLKEGWSFFPISIFLKSNVVNISLGTLLENFYHQIFDNWQIFLIMAVSVILLIYIKVKKPSEKYLFYMNIIFILTSFFQLSTTSRYNYHYNRLNLYTLILGIYVVSFSLYGLKTRKIVYYLFMFLLIIFSVKNGLYYLNITRRATTNIYEQQYQMAIFVKNFYEGKNVALNDIGAVNFFSDIRCFDTYGLATLQVAKDKINRSYSRDRIDYLTEKEGVKIAIIYDEWLRDYGGVPKSWSKICEWRISDNVICGGDRVSFYAVDLKEKENLFKNLKLFSKNLPDSVSVRFFSTH